MKRSSCLLLVAFAAVFFSSCKNSSSDLSIPKDAGLVVHIDVASLTSKLKWEDIKNSQWFRDATENENDSLTKKLMENPEASGIDIRSEFVFFTKKQGKSNYMVFEGKLKNASAFEAMLVNKDKSLKVEKNGNLSYVRSDGNAAVSWTSSVFVLLTTAPEASYGNPSWERQEIPTDSLVKFTKDLLAISGDNSLKSDDRFSALLKEKGDMHFWVNVEKYSSDMGSFIEDEMLSSLLFSLKDVYQGNVSAGTLSFEDGRIAMRSKQYLGEKMKQLVSKYEFKPVTADLVNRIPADNPLAALVANYPPELSMEIIKSTGFASIANGFLKKYNYTLEEFMQATKGQFILAVTDFSMRNADPPTEEHLYPAPLRPNVNAFFALSISNKAPIDKLIGIAESRMDSLDRTMILSKISYKTTNDWLAIGSSPQVVDAFLAGGTYRVSFADKITGHPVGMYVDLQQLGKGLKSLFMRRTADTTPGIWKDAVMIGGDYKDGVTTSELTVNFVDKSTNSLKQLNAFMEKTYLEQKKRNEEMMRNYQDLPLDSAAEAPKSY